MAQGVLDVEDTTKAIVRLLNSRSKLDAAMRSGVFWLVEYFRQLQTDIVELDDHEYGLRLLDIQAKLENGWRIVVDHMDTGGRKFRNSDGAALVAKHHMIVAQGIVGYEQTVGGNIEADITVAAAGLSTVVMKLTAPIL